MSINGQPGTNRPFPSCFEPHCKSEAKCIVMKISFQSYANKTNFHMKSFALSPFTMRFTAIRKWPICWNVVITNDSALSYPCPMLHGGSNIGQG